MEPIRPTYNTYLKLVFSLSVKSSSACSLVGGPYSLSRRAFSLPKCHLPKRARAIVITIMTIQEMKPPVYCGPGVEAKRRGPMMLPRQYPINVMPETVAFLVWPETLEEASEIPMQFWPIMNGMRRTPKYLRTCLLADE